MEKERLLSHAGSESPLQSSPPAQPKESKIGTAPSPSCDKFKDKLILGHASSSKLVDALTIPHTSPKTTTSKDYEIENDESNLDVDNQESLLIDSNPRNILRRYRTAPAIETVSEIHHSSDSNPPHLGESSIVTCSLFLLIIYLAVGVAVYMFTSDSFTVKKRHNSFVDALYFCIMTMCTIGYGDIAPHSTATKIFSIIFVLVGFGFIDIWLNGVLSFLLDLQENCLLKAIKGGGDHDAGFYVIDVENERLRTSMKVVSALGVVVLCIGIGVVFIHFVEKLSWLDSIYLSVMSVTTVGYGDMAFVSASGRVFASIWLLLSTLAVAKAFLYLAEARVDERSRNMAKWVLEQDMSVAQFLAADTDNRSSISRSDFVVHKLKEMGKVSEKDISNIHKQFERLGPSYSGKITLFNHIESRHRRLRDKRETHQQNTTE